MTRHIVIYIVTFFACLMAQAEPLTLAQQADSAYNNNDYYAAVGLYHQAMNKEGTSAQLYYNLANSYYRIGKLGKSVLYYNRALAVDPSMDDARANLEFVNKQIIDKPDDDSTFLGSVHRGIMRVMSPDAWAWTAFGLFVLMLAAAALYIFSGRIALRKLGFFGGFVLIVLFIYAVVIAAQSSSLPYDHSRAVVITPTSNFSTSPGNSEEGSKIIPVHEGTVVEIVDSITLPDQSASPLWYEVKINSSTRVWARSNDLEKI